MAKQKFDADAFNDSEEVLPLVPHQAETAVEIIGEQTEIPEILLSAEAYMDTLCIMKKSSVDEVGWLGTVKELPGRRYLIEKIFLFDQKVHGTTCELGEDGMGVFWTQMLQKDPANKEWLNRILFWGHLHPGALVDPTTQDDDQMDDFAHNDYFIRGIFTRGGRCKFTFFDYKRKLKFIDCPWSLQLVGSERYEAIAGEFKEKVKMLKTSSARSRRKYSPVPRATEFFPIGQVLDYAEEEDEDGDEKKE